MPSDMIGVPEAAHEMGVVPSRVRALIAQGTLPAQKLSGRWLISREDVLARRRDPVPSGRPLSARNAWLLLLEASGEQPPQPVDTVARWRMRRSLRYPGLAAMRPRLTSRAAAYHLWALPGELRVLRDERDVALSGSSAASALGLELVAPDTVDAYIPATRLAALVREHALQDAHPTQANVMLRAVPKDAWMLGARELAPAAAVAIDLASYADSRSARTGKRLLKELDRGYRRA
jgi:excisionase family DNA binding protein